MKKSSLSFSIVDEDGHCVKGLRSSNSDQHLSTFRKGMSRADN